MNFWPFKKKEEPVEEDLFLEEPYDPAGEARANIDSAIAVYNFLDEQDSEGPDIIKWGLKRRVLRAKRRCLEIICASVDVLHGEGEDTED